MMAEKGLESEQRKRDAETVRHFYQAIPPVVERVSGSVLYIVPGPWCPTL